MNVQNELLGPRVLSKLGALEIIETNGTVNLDWIPRRYGFLEGPRGPSNIACPSRFRLVWGYWSPDAPAHDLRIFSVRSFLF